MFDRFNGNIKPFAVDASSGKRYPFASTAEDDGINSNLNQSFLKGWEAGVNENGFPPMEWFNAVGYTSTYLSAYLYQMGIAEWNSTQEYYTNSIAVDSSGLLAMSKTGDSITPNVGNQLSGVSWGGIKIKDAETQGQAVTKRQLDAKPTGFKNYVINGELTRWSYGNSKTGNLYGYFADNFSQLNTTNTGTIEKSSESPKGFKNSAHVFDADVSVNVRQYIEDGVRMLEWKTLTCSVYVKVISGEVSFNLGDTGGNITVQPSASWQRVSFTTNNLGDTVTYAPHVFLDLGATAGAEFYFTGLQIENDSSVGNYEHLDESMNRVRCERHYQVIPHNIYMPNIGSTDGEDDTTVQSITYAEKRDIPTVSITYANMSTCVVSVIKTTGCKATGTSNAVLNAAITEVVIDANIY